MAKVSPTTLIAAMAVAAIAATATPASANPVVTQVGKAFAKRCAKNAACRRATIIAGRWLRRKTEIIVDRVTDAMDALEAGVDAVGDTWSERARLRAKVRRISHLHKLKLSKVK